MLEAGSVTKKNEVNILMKNVVDLIFGGITYWAFGFGLQYGSDHGTNPVFGVGNFLLNEDGQDEMGFVYAKFIFQMSFATTATTIVSGAMAERTKFSAFCLYCFLIIITYSVPAGWVWGDHGFLRAMGFVDFAWSSVVHLLGGVAALVSTLLLKPRIHRWGWVGFNCGSTFGIRGEKWHYAGRAAISTVNASIGGGIAGLIYTYIRKKGIVDLEDVINAILGSVVAVTAGCAFYEPWESLTVGFLSGMAVVLFFPLYDVLRIDDPVGSFAVHGIGGLSGTLCVGIFIKRDTLLKLVKYNGLIHGGGFYLLGIQALGVLSITVWSAVTTFIFLKAVNLVIPIRMKPYEEILGADFVEHNIRHVGIDYDGIMKALESRGHVIKEPWCHSIHPELQHQAEMKKWFVNLKTTGRISSATGEVKPSGGSNREEWKDEMGKFYDAEWSVLRIERPELSITAIVITTVTGIALGPSPVYRQTPTASSASSEMAPKTSEKYRFAGGTVGGSYEVPPIKDDLRVGMLEAGIVTKKKEVNILMKDVANLIFGGITYWPFGFGLQSESGSGTNPVFVGFLSDGDGRGDMGFVFAKFIFRDLLPYIHK
ncbi:unnamed protein product [Darwinula stevensoni]|uniref:Ammonium transporter AmtB-like domain-containing protein n=1 Tax=Darwinula stevensoni TaxID=69355 RepID=A0A7R8XDJ1_9CRUS|nr:unnamed protein product [Darwinula stevensoni]CAG0893555.1 unnamed protein product [Darwinula stevensoni]